MWWGLWPVGNFATLLQYTQIQRKTNKIKWAKQTQTPTVLARYHISASPLWYSDLVIECEDLGSHSSSTIEKFLTSPRLLFLICKMQLMYVLPASKGCCERLKGNNMWKWHKNYSSLYQCKEHYCFLVSVNLNFPVMAHFFVEKVS